MNKYLFLLLLLMGCGEKKETIYVWNMADVLRLWGFGIFVAIVGIVFLWIWINDKIQQRKARNKKR